ncbi:MAG: hypothetical protein LBB17_01840 [Puniceicoccales bacterium]|jgi:hypothetical protein|nr:hypothetical protein [Puniceicoccales bacterium]
MVILVAVIPTNVKKFFNIAIIFAPKLPKARIYRRLILSTVWPDMPPSKITVMVLSPEGLYFLMKAGNSVFLPQARYPFAAQP